MTFIAVLIAIVILLIGYYLMNQVDKFVESYAEYEKCFYEGADNKEIKEKVVLIYGNNELTKLVESYCHSQKYICESITDINCISTVSNYRCLFALSYDDVDNLMISSVAFKVYSIPSVIALCNNQSNLKIYNEFRFDEVLLYNDNITVLFNTIKGWLEDAAKDKVKI